MRSAAAVAALCAVSAESSADIKIKTRATSEGQSFERVVYLKGSRQRREMKSARTDGKPFDVAFVEQCDLGRMVWIDNLGRKYWVETYQNLGLPSAHLFSFGDLVFKSNQSSRARGSLTQLININDTGERREMFGYVARRIKVTMEWKGEPACKGSEPRWETDGWYVDLMYGLDCSPDISGFRWQGLPGAGGKCFDYYRKKNLPFESRVVGSARFGYPVSYKVTAYDDEGRPHVYGEEVVELVNAELDAALFEEPAGYAQIRTKSKR